MVGVTMGSNQSTMFSPQLGKGEFTTMLPVK